MRFLMMGVALSLFACGSKPGDKAPAKPQQPNAPEQKSTAAPSTCTPKITATVVKNLLPHGWTVVEKSHEGVRYLRVATPAMDYINKVDVGAPNGKLQNFAKDNSGPGGHGDVDFTILLLPRTAPEALGALVKKNAEVEASLPPAKSKMELGSRHEKAKKLGLRPVPTHHDCAASYSFHYLYVPRDPAPQKTFIGLLQKLQGLVSPYAAPSPKTLQPVK